MFNDDERNQRLRPAVLRQFVSGVMTDDERAKMWGLKPGCRMRENSKILAPDNFVCGDYVWIGEGAVLDASGGLEVGDHTSIGLGVMIWTHTSFLSNLMMHNDIGSEYIMRDKTKIGSGCFIGGPSVIYPGVTLGDRTVVLPMSVVTSDTPGDCIVAGSPAKKIRDIDEAFIEAQMEKLKAQRGGE